MIGWLCRSVVYMSSAFALTYGVVLVGLTVAFIESVLASHPGHLLPFGAVGPFHDVDDIRDNPAPSLFFEQYVRPQTPVKMSGAAKLSKAFSLWTDEYFLSTAIPSSNKINVEIAKKEIRTAPPINMHFHSYVKTYHHEDWYMVDQVPQELQSDVLLPSSLQCPVVSNEMMIAAIMWMSSGGTSSVVHTDEYENIICVFDGLKTFVMVDPLRYHQKVALDHPEGAYSAIDVDRVDYDKYPDLADVGYHVVNLTAGDCLYIPYKWIHQVRSFGRNIAVNFWWNHHKNHDLDLGQCSRTVDLHLTLDEAQLHGFDSTVSRPDSLRDHLERVIGNGVSLGQFIDEFIGGDDWIRSVVEDSKAFHMPLTQIFLMIDGNRDKVATVDELNLISERDWDTVFRQVERLDSMIDEAADAKHLQQKQSSHDRRARDGEDL